MDMQEKIAAIVRGIFRKKILVEVFVPERKEFGHYSTNIALRLAREEKKNPLELASNLVNLLQKSAPKGFFERIEVAPPGFINFWLSKETLHNEFIQIYKSRSYGKTNARKEERVIVEYSQPNIAKKLHVGHLRSTIIGDAIANLYGALGYDVIRWNYIGDWGTQFGKVIAAYKLWGDKKHLEKNPIEELVRLYVKFHKEMERSPELEKNGQEEFRKLEEGDKENRKLWKWFRDVSLKELGKMYRTLGVTFDITQGESAYEKELKPLILNLQKKGIAKESEGALIVPLEQQGLPPALVRRSDGASLYLTRDIASLTSRIKSYRPAKIVYVVGNEQTLHFEQLFTIAEMLGISRSMLTHIKFGLVVGEGGKRFSTREGDGILLEEVIKKAVALAREVVEKKNQKLPKEKKDEIAKAVGIGALKYNDLKENCHSDITFDWEKMLDFRGESGPYLQYSYARLRSILRKARGVGKFDVGLLEEEELVLIRKLLEFPDVIKKAGEEHLPNLLARYLYEVASVSNHFYESIPVIKDTNILRRNARLVLLSAASTVLKNGLGLLGIEAPEEI